MAMPDTTVADTVAALAEALAESHSLGSARRIRGSGTWLDSGRPVHAEHTLETRGTAGVIEYVPGDLVITVGAGTTLAEIAAVTAEQNQWLALDPFGDDSGTIGATVATASSGPLASGMGRVRDLVLGLSMLASDGSAVRAGGRVVKNVAGFDLVRLATGAFGTLGVITEVSVRLHARPEFDETYVVGLDARRQATDASVHGLGFLALELVSVPTVGDVPVASIADGEWALLARVSGNRDRVRAQRAQLQQFGTPVAVGNDVWQRLRAMDGARSAVVRVTDAPSKLGGTIIAVQQALSAAGVVDAALCATPSTGRVRVSVPYRDEDDAAPRALVKSMKDLGASVVWERLPADCWAWVPPAATDPVSVRIRDAFDPHHTLNRGIFGPMGGH
ncbi:MAG TPA: FAD-binding protein [Gemmatimonas sp.]|nr:FAD-binding protein [Gemmatimonas sp.]